MARLFKWRFKSQGRSQHWLVYYELREEAFSLSC